MTIHDIVRDGFKKAFKGQLFQNGNPVSASNPLPVTSAGDAAILSLLNQINGGSTGSPLYIAGTYTGLSHTKLVVNADVVFTELRDNNGEDLLALFNYAGQTLKQGAVIVPLAGTRIADITISSGSVIGYGE